MAKRRKIYDFAFDPTQSQHHFAVIVDREGRVSFVERFVWETDAEEPTTLGPQPKAVLDGYRWSRVRDSAADVFNQRMRQAGHKAAIWKGETVLAPHFGKELTLLAWAVEDADPTLIPNMVANWAGLAPEERWWLYTTINATTTHPEHGKDRGWRKAIKIAFAENPTGDALPSALLATPADSNEIPAAKATRRAKTKREPIEPTQTSLLVE